MARRAPSTEATGTSGASYVTGQFEELGWGVVANPNHDIGTDLVLIARDERQYEVNVLLGAQVKTGSSYFAEPETDDAGTVVGWWFREAQDYFEYWSDHNPPHLIVLHRPDDHVSYWVQVTADTYVITGKQAKILVPASQTVDADHRAALFATARRKTTVWEGSAWTGATPNKSELLRYALLVPRLIAPHPNVSIPDDLGVEACLALVVLRRTDDIGRRWSHPGLLPELPDAAMRGWRWEFAAVLEHYLTGGDPDPLIDVAGRGSEPSERAAATVAAAAALLELARPAAAADLLESALEADDMTPVDHAWMTAQTARSYIELGREAAAREAVGGLAQRLVDNYGGDPTAGAIAGAIAQLSFTLSDWAAGGLPATVAAGDTVAAWWRSQVLCWGLGRQAQQQFAGWAGDAPTGSGYEELRSATLLSGLAGDHGGWRHAASRIARQQLVLTSRTSSPDRIWTHIDLLRLAGDDAELKRAIRSMVRVGPARAVQLTGAALDLTQATRTTARAGLIILEHGGDVIGSDDADRHTLWALDRLADPGRWDQDLQLTFMVSNAILGALRGLAQSTSSAVAKQIAETVLDLPPQADQLTAQDWGRLALSLPESAWNADTSRHAAEKASTHNFELQYSLLEIAARHHTDVREKLLLQAKAGDARAIAALGDVKDLTEPTVSALVDLAVTQVAIERQQAEQGLGYGVGTINWGRLLAALNLLHPEAADWSSLLDLLRDPSAYPQQLTPALRILTRLADEIPAEWMEDISSAVQALTQPEERGFPIDGLMEAAKAFVAIAQDLKGSTDDRELQRLLVGSSADRHTAVTVIARRANPADLTLLATLIADQEAAVRATAAETLGDWASRGLISDHVALDALIESVLTDPGTWSARRFMSGLRGGSATQILQRHGGVISTHPSAQVRRRA